MHRNVAAAALGAMLLVALFAALGAPLRYRAIALDGRYVYAGQWWALAAATALAAGILALRRRALGQDRS